MAKYDHLKVFKDFYSFSKDSINAVRKFPRIFKYTLGTSIQNNIYEVLKNIVKVNALKEKKELLSEIIIDVELLQIQIRLAKDLNCFTKIDTYFYLSEQITNILKQLEGWKRASS